MFSTAGKISDLKSKSLGNQIVQVGGELNHMTRNRDNPGGKYFGGLNYRGIGTESTKGAAKAEAARQRRHGYYARVTKNSNWGWDVWIR